MVIVRDTREQRGYDFEGFGVEVVEQALPTGDYSLQGFEGRAAIERKNLSDLMGSLTWGRARFERELQRGQELELFAVVCEADFGQLVQGAYRSKMSPASAVGSVVALQVRYGCPFLWAGSRSGGELRVYQLLQKFYRQAVGADAVEVARAGG